MILTKLNEFTDQVVAFNSVNFTTQCQRWWHCQPSFQKCFRFRDSRMWRIRSTWLQIHLFSFSQQWLHLCSIILRRRTDWDRKKKFWHPNRGRQAAIFASCFALPRQWHYRVFESWILPTSMVCLPCKCSVAHPVEMGESEKQLLEWWAEMGMARERDNSKM